jgi:hypothetical protein
MSNPGLFVRLDPETFEELRKVAEEERRTQGDQAAVLIRTALDARKQNERAAA